MPYRQVHVDPLLRSIIDTVDIGHVARKASPYWPLTSGKTSHIQNEYPTYFLFTKTVGENPRHATTEGSQLEIMLASQQRSYNRSKTSMINAMGKVNGHTRRGHTDCRQTATNVGSGPSGCWKHG